jgi:CHAT domain-containing protein
VTRTQGLRTIGLLLVLVVAGGYYLTQNAGVLQALGRRPAIPGLPSMPDTSASLPFDATFKQGIEHYIEGVSVDPSEDSVDAAIKLDQEVGRPQIAHGQYKEAYRTYQKVLAISYRKGNLMGIGIALNILADMSYRGQNKDEALYTTALAYKVATQMNNKEEMGVVELSFARMLQDDDPGSAMMWLLRAKADLENSSYKEDYVRALPGLARSLRVLGDDDKASRLLAEAWGLAQPLGDAPGQKWTKAEVAVAYVDDLDQKGQHDKALEVLEKARTFYSPEEKKTDPYTAILYRLGRARAGLGKQAEAGRDYLAAYANYELTRADAPGEDARAALDRDQKALVDDFVDFHIRTKDDTAALALLESSKARTLNDVLDDPSYKAAQDQWKEMERRQARETSDFLDKPADELLPDAPDRLPAFVALMQKQEDGRRSLQASLQLRDAIVTSGMTRESAQKLVAGLPADVAVLSFFVSRRNPGVFLATSRGVQYFPATVDTAAYEREVHALRVALTNPDNDFYREPAQSLYERILKPALRALPPTVKILVYSADGMFNRVPLEVLMDGEHFLGERYAVYRVPSLRYTGVIKALKAAPARHGVACVDPDIPDARLPFQQETGRTLERLYGGSVTDLVGKDCSEARLASTLKAQTVPTFLHVGAHGNFYPEDAMESAIWLSPEEATPATPTAWNAKAMATVDMSHVDLVTLSSCETGLTDMRVPRDTFGIARALFFAGARSVVAPLWAVDDRATAEYMKAFHAAYARNVPAVLSLQQAQTALLRGGKYAHPYYWSAFVLTGASR